MQKYQQRAFGLVTIRKKAYPYLVTTVDGNYIYKRVATATGKIGNCCDEKFMELLRDDVIVAEHFLSWKPVLLKSSE